jgi:hypothetical protein
VKITDRYTLLQLMLHIALAAAVLAVLAWVALYYLVPRDVFVYLLGWRRC